MPCVWSQVSKKMSMKIPYNFSRQNNRFLCNRPDRSLKASGRPAVSRSFSVEERPDIRATPSGRQSNTARNLGQASPNSTQSWISEVDTIWKVYARHPDDVATRPNAVSSISEYFGLPFRTRKGFMAKTVLTLGQAVWTWTLLWKLLALFWKGSCS
jgi:hypothetical protein